MFDREALFRAIHEEKWLGVFGILAKHKKEISNDSVSLAAVRAFAVSLRDTFNKNPTRELATSLTVTLQHLKSMPSVLDQEQIDAVLSDVIAYESETVGVATAYQTARYHRHIPIAEKVAAEYEASLPTIRTHSLQHIISVTENKDVSKSNHTIPLFRSPNERCFFEALVDQFPHRQIYPNVAVNSILDFEALSPLLTPRQRKYFLMAIVDCAVFDQNADYTPILFFEIDSSHHDSEQQKAKDEMKDLIFSLAGQQIYRIRPKTSAPTKNEFLELLGQIIK